MSSEKGRENKIIHLATTEVLKYVNTLAVADEVGNQICKTSDLYFTYSSFLALKMLPFRLVLYAVDFPHKWSYII